MSIITLTAFSVFRKVGGTAEILCGASGYTIGERGFVLQVTSVPLPGNTFPKFSGGALALLYGFRDALDELRRQRQVARRIGGEFVSLELEFDVGEIVPGFIGPDKLNGLQFANVRRMTSELQEMISERFAKYIAQKGSAGHLEDLPRLQFLAQHPELFGHFLETDPDFQTIDVLVIPVAPKNQKNAMRQVALVRPTAKLRRSIQNTELDILVLPDGFGGREKHAAEHN